MRVIAHHVILSTCLAFGTAAREPQRETSFSVLFEVSQSIILGGIAEE